MALFKVHFFGHNNLGQMEPIGAEINGRLTHNGAAIIASNLANRSEGVAKNNNNRQRLRKNRFATTLPIPKYGPTTTSPLSLRSQG